MIADSRCNIEDLLGQLSLYGSKANALSAENAKTLEACKKRTEEIEELRGKNKVLERSNLQEFQEGEMLQQSVSRVSCRSKRRLR